MKISIILMKWYSLNHLKIILCATIILSPALLFRQPSSTPGTPYTTVFFSELKSFLGDETASKLRQRRFRSQATHTHNHKNIVKYKNRREK